MPLIADFEDLPADYGSVSFPGPDFHDTARTGD